MLLPESYDDWNDFDTYSDLVLFERDLGYLTSAVLVFVEAPGAIAELGAFSQIPSLSERLVIVITENRHPRKSFISLGPIRSVANTQKHPFSVCIVPNVKPKDVIIHMPVVMGTLDSKRKQKVASITFNKEEPQHQILLILDFINLFFIITVLELKKLAYHFGVDFSIPRLNQILFTLEKTGLIVSQGYGATTYFVPKKFRKSYIDYTSVSSENPFNRDRTKAQRWSEIQEDQYRRNAYALANKKKGAA